MCIQVDAMDNFEFDSVIDCVVRFTMDDTNASDGSLDLWWRVKWTNGVDADTHSTIVSEASFTGRYPGKHLASYAARHPKSIQTKVTKALLLHPNIKAVSSAYYTQPDDDLTLESGEDNQADSASSGGTEGDSEDDFHARQAEGVVTVESEEDAVKQRFLIAQVTAKGVMMWSTAQIAAHFALHEDENLMMGTGNYLAQRITTADGAHRFVIDKSILESGIAMKVWGNASEGANEIDDCKDVTMEPLWEPPPWASNATFGSDHLDAVYNWLHNHTRSADCAKSADFIHNTRRRYELKGGRLYYKRGRRKAKNLPKRIMRSSVPNVEVVRQDLAWLIVEADHKKYHDGHNRAEERLGNRYLIVRVRTMTKYARDLCKVCESFENTIKDAVQPIITTRPMELVMFDLFFLPFKDDEGQGICMMIIDHFTKYKWGATMTRKTMYEVAEILIAVFRMEGNCERWHSDNGSEFLNYVVTHARKVLNIPQLTNGRPRHPQCQGLVERANGTCKRKVLMNCAAEGLKNGDSKWNWKKHLEDVLMNENDAPLKVYKGLNAFFCLRNRQRDIVTYNPLAPEDMTELHGFMRNCQLEQGKKMKHVASLETFEIADKVRVRAGYQEVKKRAVLGTWSTEATICEVHPKAANYYRLRWTTRGLNAEPQGSISKRWFPWTAMKKMAKSTGSTLEEANEENAGGEAAACEEEGKEAGELTVTMSKSPAVLQDILHDVTNGRRVAWGNKMNSCHVDAYLMLELAAVVAAPWRLQDQALRRTSRDE